MMFSNRLRFGPGNPGSLYNIGNGIVLAGGFAGALAAAIGPGGGDGQFSERVFAHLWGSPAALALTLATMTFFAGGAAYSAAWKGPGPGPDPKLSQRGDLLSGIGAIVLGVGLVLLGDAFLAICAGLLHASGKFGSAWGGARLVRTPAGALPLSELCKDLVLVSRIPALLAAVSGLVASTLGTAGIAAILLAGSVVISTMYWAAADILLLRRNGMLLTAVRNLIARVRSRLAAE
jgi:hypothetical protein